MLYASEVAVAHRNLATIDLVIIGVYFAIVFGIGIYFARKERTSEDYFLAGRDIGWFFIGASLFVSNISTEHFIGLSGTGASSGLAVGHFEWLACLILLILWWGFCPFLSTKQCLHDARILGTAFQSAMRRVLGGNLHHRLHLYQNLSAALCRQRGSGTRRGLVAMEDRCGFGHCDRHLHGCRRFGRGHLYGHC